MAEEDPKDKKIRKVVKEGVVVKKRGVFSRIGSAIFGGDGGSVSEYIVREVLIPAFKNTVSDMIEGGINMLLYGDERHYGGRSHATRGNYTSYDQYYASRDRNERRQKASHDFGRIIFRSRAEAQDALDQLAELIDKYEVATLDDLYEMVGQTSSYRDSDWGWTSLGGAGIRRVAEGYILQLPKPHNLD